MNVSIASWASLLASILLMLGFDLFFQGKQREPSLKSAALWSAFWIACGLVVGAVIWVFYGGDFGLQYLTGYVIEKSLAADNVFVWALLFTALAVPKRYQRRVLYFGVIGALVLRSIMIFLGSALIHEFSWVLYLFGALLIVTGVKMFVQRKEHLQLQESRIFQLSKSKLRLTSEIEDERFTKKVAGVRYFTPLFLVLVMVEFMDLVFAVDSIPAIFGITEEPFLVFASNAMAILGLRSLYFLIADFMGKFRYLKEGLSVVLLWVGAKMILGHSLMHIPTWVSLVVIVFILSVAMAASTRKVPADAK